MQWSHGPTNDRNLASQAYTCVEKRAHRDDISKRLWDFCRQHCILEADCRLLEHQSGRTRLCQLVSGANGEEAAAKRVDICCWSDQPRPMVHLQDRLVQTQLAQPTTFAQNRQQTVRQKGTEHICLPCRATAVNSFVVDWATVFRAAHHFWCNILWRAAAVTVHVNRWLAFLESSREAKVDKAEIEVTIKQDVLRLDVQVHDLYNRIDCG